MATGPIGSRSSVRLRITAVATAVVLLTLGVACWALFATLESALGSSQDQAARSRADDLLVLAAAGQLPSTVATFGDDGFIQVVRDGGQVVASTAHLRGRPPVASFRPAVGSRMVRTVRDVRDDRDLENYRVWAARGPSPGGPVTVYAATSLERVSEIVSTLRRLLLLGVPLVAALLAVLTWVVVGRALRPVESIRAEVAAISEADLGRRVPAPPGDDEIARLARTMNAMLDRLEQANVRQAAFTADASHELQSPLTTLRAQLEVALARPTDADWPAVGGELLDEVQEMERMVRDLLFLARATDGDERLDGLVDLDDVVLEEAARARSTTSVQVLTSSVSAAPVRGSRDQLVRLTRNLLENACRHASSTVDVSLAVVGSTVRLAIRDDGPGVPASARERIFERFVRVDDARSRQVAGTGLGLSIVAAVAARHGGSVRLLDGDGDGAGATFVLVLPADSGPI